MPNNPLTEQELYDYGVLRSLTPSPEIVGRVAPYMPKAYFLVPPHDVDGEVKWRLFDAAYISTGIIDPNRLGTGATGSGTLFLADDGTWKVAGGSGGGGLPVGGTAGQILAKIDNVDYNAEWIDNYALWTSQVKHEVKAGQSISKGQAVYVSSADGTNMVVSKASNTAEMTSSKTMGLLAQSLNTNGKGFVITEGLLSGLNTSSATIGDPVWLGTNGDLIYGIANKPVAPAHMVFLGIVTRVNNNNGEIFVKVQNGFEIEELHDVKITNPTDGQIIKYNGSTNLWENYDVISSFKIDYDYNIVGARDGSNTNFNTTSNYRSGTTRVYLNGQRLTPGIGYDYIEASINQISLFYSPLPSDRLIIEYEIL